MARQFKGSAQSKGFGAATASNAAEQRIAQQTSRVVAGMERFRDSDLENRKRILQDMEENAQYTQTRLERDRKILASNKGKQAQQVAYDAEGAAKRAASNAKATSDVFKAVADLSATAAKKADEADQQRVDEEYAAGVRARQLAGPNNVKQVQYDALTSLEGQAREARGGPRGQGQGGAARDRRVHRRVPERGARVLPDDRQGQLGHADEEGDRAQRVFR